MSVVPAALPISKTAQLSDNFKRSLIGFPSARDAFEGFIRACGLTEADRVLLPSFIGWSAREGSGVFDPIRNTKVRPVFYRMTEDLLIDVEDVEEKIRTAEVRMLVLIHYFGYPDPSARHLVEYARKHGVTVVEDEAHAMLSDIVGGICGRWGDASFISLHKMLPFAGGGALIVNQPEEDRGCILSLRKDSHLLPFWEYDLHEISRIRRNNAATLLAGLDSMRDRVKLLQPLLPEGIVPQTLPIAILRKDRNDLYFTLNESGFGVVSLYHTMIDSIDRDEFPDAYTLASRIMNLPVHQDVTQEQIASMLEKLDEVL